MKIQIRFFYLLIVCGTLISCSSKSETLIAMEKQLQLQTPIMQELLSITACEGISLEIKAYGKYWVYNYSMTNCGFTHNQTSVEMLKDIIREKHPEICDQVVLKFTLIRNSQEEVFTYLYCK